MSNVLHAFLSGVPPTATAQHKGAVRVGNGIRFFEKKEVRSAREQLMGMLRPHVPADPFEGELSVCVQFVWPHLKSSTKGVKERCLVPLTTRPDVDNLVKMFLDVMTQMSFWKDDGQVWNLTVRKWRGHQPGIYVDIDRLGEY